MLTGESPKMLLDIIMTRFEEDYSPQIIYLSPINLFMFILALTLEPSHENDSKKLRNQMGYCFYNGLCSIETEGHQCYIVPALSTTGILGRRESILHHQPWDSSCAIHDLRHYHTAKEYAPQ